MRVKAFACEKKIDLNKIGGGEPDTLEVNEDILNIICRVLERMHNTVDDDAPALQVLVKEDELM